MQNATETPEDWLGSPRLRSADFACRQEPNGAVVQGQGRELGLVGGNETGVGSEIGVASTQRACSCD